ncbi:hypothetical protein [Coralliovum pocilloporae]|uniref:hypothetical protein n=1 Tax=Coralliovum pocilloporae TaxID=3066369 RepID=UPI003306A71C
MTKRSLVRVITFDPTGFQFDTKTRDKVMSFIGDICAVTEIDEYGYVWVSKDFGPYEHHTIKLEPEEYEWVSDRPTLIQKFVRALMAWARVPSSR